VKDLDFGAIKAADKLRTEPVDAPEWGGRVYVRTITAAEYAAYMAGAANADGKVDHAAWQNGLVAVACCDAAGAAIFPDAAAVGGLNESAPVRRIFAAAQKLNKLGRHDADAEKKDSAGTTPAGSPTA
jgi:hypothetical protein